MDKLVQLVITSTISRFTGYLYTGKLAKTIIMRANPAMRSHFEPIKGSAPKLIHVSPLYRVNERGKIECIYSSAICRDDSPIVKCDGPPKPVLIDGLYHFYLGIHTSTIDISSLINSLINYNECFEFMNQHICVEVISLAIENPFEASRKIVEEIIKANGLKVELSSPTLLRDPLRTRGKYKTFLPSPEIVFAAPLYSLLYSQGRYKRRVFIRDLVRLRRLFNDTYSILTGLRVKWVYYTNRPEPALVGYVNYRINMDYFEHLKKMINVEEWLSEIFAYAIALGVGAGRATGFGHVFLKPLVNRGNSENIEIKAS